MEELGVHELIVDFCAYKNVELKY